MFSYELGDGARLAMLEPWHAEQFLAAVERSREYLKTAIPMAHTVHTVADAATYLQRFADGHAKDTERLCGLWLDGTLVGVVQLFNWNARAKSCEIGVWLAPEAQGRRLVTRACRYILDWVFRDRDMRRVQWTNTPANVRSGAVARRLGMTREGVLRDAWAIADVRSDLEVWSILADEWRLPQIE